MEALLLAEEQAKAPQADFSDSMTKEMVEVFRAEVDRRVMKQTLKDSILCFRRVPLFEQLSAVKIFTKYQQTFVITENSELWACGRGEVGQLGFGRINEIHNPRRLAFVVWSKDMAPAEVGRRGG